MQSESRLPNDQVPSSTNPHDDCAGSCTSSCEMQFVLCACSGSLTILEIDSQVGQLTDNGKPVLRRPLVPLLQPKQRSQRQIVFQAGNAASAQYTFSFVPLV